MVKLIEDCKQRGYVLGTRRVHNIPSSHEVKKRSLLSF